MLLRGQRLLCPGFEVEEFDAVGAAAGGADGFGVDADDLAELVMTMNSLVCRRGCPIHRRG